MKRRYLQSNGRLEFNEHHCTWTPPNSTELMFQRRSYSHVFRKQTPTTRTKLNRTPRHFQDISRQVIIYLWNVSAHSPEPFGSIKCCFSNLTKKIRHYNYLKKKKKKRTSLKKTAQCDNACLSQ